MKKTVRLAMVGLLLAILQLTGNVTIAKDINPATAKQLGAYYMSVMTGKTVAEEGQVHLVHTFSNPNMDIPSAYVFNISGQGMVIVSGSDLCYPILGYSAEGELDTARIAPSFLAYFGDIAGRIGHAQRNDQPMFRNMDKIEAEWDALRNHALQPDPKASQWLVDACWDQGQIYYPTYNAMCPSGPDQWGYTGYAYVGCVATAMAQIMHYWKYPDHGNGYIGYSCYLNRGESYETYIGYLDINLNEHTYDYANMPNANLSPYSPTTQINACALLCYHCGVSVRMQYGFSGSGTQSSYVADAMVNKFRYSSDATFLRRSTIHNYESASETMLYTDDEWIGMMHEEIDAQRPIYFSGYSVIGSGRDAGGHAFVADGYLHNQPDKFHFNWGWGGTPNTWSDLRLGDLNASGYNFYFGQAMVKGLHPREDEVVCQPVTELSVEEASATSANLTWESGEGQRYWRVGYGLESDSASYMEVESTVTNFTAQGLQPGKWYVAKVQGRCNHSCTYPNGVTAHDTVLWSDWSDTVRFYVGQEPLAIEEASAQQISLMPNPAHDHVVITLPSEGCEVEIYAADGRRVARLHAPSIQMEANISNYAPGTYLVKVIGPKGTSTQKLIVR